VYLFILSSKKIDVRVNVTFSFSSLHLSIVRLLHHIDQMEMTFVLAALLSFFSFIEREKKQREAEKKRERKVYV
jgi:hypothetical protein